MRRGWKGGVWLASLWCLLCLGCSGTQPYDPAFINPPAGSTTFTIAPIPEQTVVPGGTATFPITVTKVLETLASRSGPVTLTVEGLPEGYSASFSKNPVTPTFEGTNLTMTVEQEDAGSLPRRILGAGDFVVDLTVRGEDGEDVRTQIARLRFVTPIFDLEGAPEQMILQGNQATFTISLRATSSGQLPVTLSVSGGQPGSTVVIDPDSVTPTAEGVDVEVQVQSVILPVGTFTYTVTATNGFYQQEENLILDIEPG